MLELIVSGVVGGVVVALVTAWLAKRQKASEIETIRLLEAYSELQEGILVIGDVKGGVFDGLSEEEAIDVAARTGRVVAMLDLLGSREVLRAIRLRGDAEGNFRELDITATQTALRSHIRKRLGLPVRGIPRQLTIHSRSSLERLMAEAGSLPLGSPRGRGTGNHNAGPTSNSGEQDS